MLAQAAPDNHLKTLHEKPLSGRSVLIIEDEYLIALEAQRIVENAGAETVVLENTVAGVRELLAHRPGFDLAILDLKLGAEDGTPLMDDLGNCGIPFIVATGFHDDPELKGVVLIRKPYRDTEVVGAIRSLARQGGSGRRDPG